MLTQKIGNQTTNLNYDLDGNLKNDSKFHYVFDAFQRIVEVKDQNQNLVAKYQMDTSNRRISKTIGTTVHRTVYAGWQVAEEHETVPSGKKFKTTTKVYVYGQYIDEPLVMQVTKPNGNQKKFWYLRNQQYSIYALTNDNGKIIETYRYSAYGELEIKDADGSTLTESAYANTYFYTGRLLDQETGLFYFRNRYYNANQGRFISRDPLGYVDGMSLYRGYFAVNGVDWSGTTATLDEVCPRSIMDDFRKALEGLIGVEQQANARIINIGLGSIGYNRKWKIVEVSGCRMERVIGDCHKPFGRSYRQKFTCKTTCTLTIIVKNEANAGAEPNSQGIPSNIGSNVVTNEEVHGNNEQTDNSSEENASNTATVGKVNGGQDSNQYENVGNSKTAANLSFTNYTVKQKKQKSKLTDTIGCDKCEKGTGEQNDTIWHQ